MHLKLVKAHLALLEPAEQVEVNLIEMVSPPVPEVPTEETRAVPMAARKVPNRKAKAAPAAREGDSTEEAEVVFMSIGRASSNEAEMASPSREREQWACPINECRETAAHPLDSCKGFGDLSVTKRRKVLRERKLCEYCLTDCKDKKTGARCYQQTGFRRHRLLRMAVQQEGRAERRAVARQGCGSGLTAQRRPP